jgi:hypothetical protein
MAFDTRRVPDVIFGLGISELVSDLGDRLVWLVFDCFRRGLPDLHCPENEACDSDTEHYRLYFHVPVSMWTILPFEGQLDFG